MKIKKKLSLNCIHLHFIHSKCTAKTYITGWQPGNDFPPKRRRYPIYELTYKQKPVINPVSWTGTEKEDADAKTDFEWTAVRCRQT